MAFMPTSLRANIAPTSPLITTSFTLTHQGITCDLLPVLFEFGFAALSNSIPAGGRISAELVAEEIENTSRLSGLLLVGAVPVLGAEAPGAHTSPHLLLLHHHAAAEEAVGDGQWSVDSAWRHNERVSCDKGENSNVGGIGSEVFAITLEVEHDLFTLVVGKIISPDICPEL
jgi:hypothetical protein